MTTLLPIAAVVAATLLVGAQANGQTLTAPPTDSPALPKWDVSAGYSLLWVRGTDVGTPWDGFEEGAEFRVDLGRYWTPHLKTGVLVATGPKFFGLEDEWLVVGGIRRFASIGVSTRLTTIAPGVTYQFLDNAFMHPYVTGGVHIGVLQVHREREAAVYGANSLPAIDDRRTELNARPFAAAGFKSYINRSTFVRTEAMAAFGPRGATHLTLHLGVGIDF